MPAHRLRYWPSIEPTLACCLLITMFTFAWTPGSSLPHERWFTILSFTGVPQINPASVIPKTMQHKEKYIYRCALLFSLNHLRDIINEYYNNIIFNCHPLEVVSRYRDPQLQLGESCSYLFYFRTNICKS